MSNVIIAKNYGTSVMEDLSLIRNSLMYIGTNSGVNTIAQFSNLPYIIYQFIDKRYVFDGDRNFIFANDNQKLYTHRKLTVNFLEQTFDFVYKNINKSEWLNRIANETILS